MAIVFLGKTECSICGKVIVNCDDIIATSHFIADKNDPLWRFSDSAMHRCCFMEWNQRAEFVAKFNRIVGEITWGDGTYQHMKPDGTTAVLRRE